MQYIKYEMGPYNLHMIKTDRFKTITARINFKRKLVKEEINYRNLISTIMLESSKNFPTKRLLTLETEELYGLSCESSAYTSGNYAMLAFNFTFLHKDYTEEGMLEKSIAFIKEILFNPNVTNGKFDSDSFLLSLNQIKEEIEELPERTKSYSEIRLLEEIDKESPISYRNIGYLEGLDDITPEDLYTYYKSIINNDVVDIFIIGNIDLNNTKQTVSKELSIRTIKKLKGNHFINHTKFRYRSKKVIEKTDNSQTRLLLGYKMKDLTVFERNYVVYILSYILGGGGDSKLFKTVREKNSLCYNIFSSVNLLSNIFMIAAGIDYKDYEKALRLIKKEEHKMSKGEFTLEDIERAKMIYKSSCQEFYDNPFSIIKIYMAKEYMGTDLIDERIKNVDKVTPAMITTVAKKLHLDTVYLLKGGKQ